MSTTDTTAPADGSPMPDAAAEVTQAMTCLLYTSDAADE